jgi:hypothetical protein
MEMHYRYEDDSANFAGVRIPELKLVELMVVQSANGQLSVTIIGSKVGAMANWSRTSLDRFAKPTKELALRDYIARKSRQKKVALAVIRNADILLECAKNLLNSRNEAGQV